MARNYNRRPPVGYVLKTFPKLSETFILNEILELERQGLSLHLFSLRSPQDEKFHPTVGQVRAEVTYIPSLLPRFTLQAAKQLLRSHVDLLLQNPQRYRKMWTFYQQRTEEKRLNEFLQAGYLVRELQQRGIPHLHAHFANVPTAVAEMVKQYLDISYSLTAHAKDIYLSKPEVLDRRIKSAKFVLTCTGYNQTHLNLISTGFTPIYLSYHGIDFNRFQPTQKRAAYDVPLVLSVGRFCEKKGFPDLLHACYQLKQAGKQFHCAIVGYGPLQHDIEQQIHSLQLQDIVSLPGKMTQDQLIQLYQQADIFVLPCQVLENGDRDGIPNVLLEAMAMKVPVISTDISGISELIDHLKNGILVAQKDPDALAAELGNLLAEPRLRQQLGQAGQDRVLQQFSLSQNVRQIHDLLLEVLPDSSHSTSQRRSQEVTV